LRFWLDTAGRIGWRISSGGRVQAAGEPREGLTVVPRHPVGGILGDLPVVTLQRYYVRERVDTAELCGVNQAHKGIADVSAVQCLVEQGVLSMEDGLLQGPFTDVMPTSGLCRVVDSWSVFYRIFCPAVIAHAA
jgi:hypothetical protein